MKQPLRCICAVFLLLFTVLLIGCNGNLQKEVLDNKSINSLYDKISDNLFSSNLITLNTTEVSQTTAGTYAISDKISRKITYSNYGKDNPIIFIDQNATYGNHLVHSLQQYQDSCAYWELNGTNIKATVSENHLIHSPLPQISNYKTLYGYTEGNYTYLYFCDPIANGTFTIPLGNTLEDATALIILTKKGDLLRWQTTLVYRKADAITYTRTFATPSGDPSTFDLTAENAEFLEVSSLDAVIMLERISGFLSSVQPINAESVHTITCEANTLERTQITKVKLSGEKEQLNASVDTSVVTIDHARNDTITNEHQLETFADNLYTLQSNNLDNTNPDVTYDIMESYCRNTLVSTLPLLHYITDAQVYTEGGSTICKFTGSQELSELICSEACKLLYQDPGYLDALATDKTILSTECILRIHPQTGLPESSSIEYRGTHTIEEKVYAFTSKTVQTYSFP